MFEGLRVRQVGAGFLPRGPPEWERGDETGLLAGNSRPFGPGGDGGVTVDVLSFFVGVLSSEFLGCSWCE
jgi:hypothetical protein